MKKSVNSQQECCLSLCSGSASALPRRVSVSSKMILSLMILSLMILSIIVLLTGCAGFKEYDDKGKLVSRTEAGGFLRTITVKQTYYPGKDGKRGTLKEKVVSTDSTTKDVLLGLNEMIDTAANTAAKLKP